MSMILLIVTRLLKNKQRFKKIIKIDHLIYKEKNILEKLIKIRTLIETKMIKDRKMINDTGQYQ